MPTPGGLPRLLIAVVAVGAAGAACRSPLDAAGAGAGQHGLASATSTTRRGTAVQAIFGAAEFHDLEVERVDPSDPTRVAAADLSTMPVLGIAGQEPLAGHDLEVGLDGGLLVSWESDGATVRSAGSGTVIVAVDVDLVVLDVFFGVYASTILGDQLRLYAAAGPSVMWGTADYRDEIGEDQGSGFGFGGYVRGGAEYRLADRSFLGVGARGVINEIDVGGSLGEADLDGWQVFLTFTQGF